MMVRHRVSHLSRLPLIALLLCMMSPWCAARGREPVIDMHVHSRKGDYRGAELPRLCLPVLYMPRWDPASPIETGLTTHVEARCRHPLVAVPGATQFMRDTLALMEQRNIIAVVSGEPDVMATWKAAAPERVIVGSDLRMLKGSADGRLAARTPDDLQALHDQGLLQVLGEVMSQYQGMAPNDERLEPYWALAESLDVPVGIHMGPGTAGDPYVDGGRFRARDGNPLTLEDVLVSHPRLRLYIMHAGYPFIDDLRALMYTHPQVYVDVAAIVNGEPRPAFYRFLQELVDAGFGDRIMFGSDPGLWPGLITASIDVIEKAPFLTKAQKRGILYDNAARFLRLSKETIARHHAM